MREFYYCKYCDNNPYNLTNNKNTSLLKHIRSHHGDLLNKKAKEKHEEQKTIKECFGSIDLGLCREISELIAKSGFSFNAVANCPQLQNYFKLKYDVNVFSPTTVHKYMKMYLYYIKVKQKKYLSNLKKVQFKIVFDE